ncbi:MAG: ABC transporter permease [Verrucomicrobiae bacterium]|jgi:phospholipid/cholesterol/gamma-HCH transport system permease protein|nr:ABC transporter permease [Verrucomicrobiae bacterium]
MFRDIGQLAILAWRTLRSLPLIFRHYRKLIDQLFEIGNASLLMSCILAVFIGGVLALQTGPVMVEQGLNSVVGAVVGLSVCKELAPVMIAVLIAGRIGSAMAAEIGSMAVYQEIDALRTMNINPIHYLVLPRVLAVCIALPCLVVFADLIGWVGGALVCMSNPKIGIPWQAYFNDLSKVVDTLDVLNGLIKSLLFAAIIGLVGCHQGLATIGGPRGIGRSVTKSVVNAIVLILITDYFITRLLLTLDL